MKRMIAIIALGLFLCLSGLLPGKPDPAFAACATISTDPYSNGLYASDLLTFVAGYWVNLRGPDAINWRHFREKKSLHPARLVNPARFVLGCPKDSLESSLTLGHEGFVIVGPSKCFRNGQGPDILVHEPRSDLNTAETINVYVTTDEKGEGPWYKIADKKTVDKSSNYLELELDGIVNERGYPIEEFRWVKVEDANSKLVLSNKRFSGFEVSAVKFLHQCAIQVGAIRPSILGRISPVTSVGNASIKVN